MSDDVDELLGALHGDKKRVLKGQLTDIEKEIVERRLIAADTSIAVNDEIGELRNEVVNLQPASEQMPDVARKDRFALERERSELAKELRFEQRDAWKDVQQLRREEREVEKELTISVQQHKRVRELL